MRKSISRLFAGTALSAAFLTAAFGATAPAAEAASCRSWNVPATMTLKQGNGYTVKVTKRDGIATAYGSGSAMFSEDVAFTSFTAAKIRFIITWSNGSAGVYEGSIDRDGFISGTTRDRWTPSSKTSWSMRGRATCAR